MATGRARGSRVRVLRVIARLNAGGPAHHVGLLASRLGAGYETLVVHGRVPAGEAPLARFDERYPCRRVELSTLGPEIRPLDDLRALVRLIVLVRRMRPDIVHTHTAKAGLVGRLAALSVHPRPAIVHTFHGHVLEGYFGRLQTGFYRYAERALARVTDRLVGVSDATVADLRRLGVGTDDTLRVVRLGLELEPFLAAERSTGSAFRAEAGVRLDEVLVVAVGRLVPIKRYDVALLAVEEAIARGAHVRAAIVGDGPLRAELTELAERLGIADRVSFTGFRGDLVEIAAAADIALLSSDNEGTPVWLIEAAAAATAAVATDVGGVRDVVPQGTGILVPAGDHAALGAALTETAADAAGREAMAAAARLHVGERYASSRMLADVDELYAELLADGDRPGRTPPRFAAPR